MSLCNCRLDLYGCMVYLYVSLLATIFLLLYPVIYAVSPLLHLSSIVMLKDSAITVSVLGGRLDSL